MDSASKEESLNHPLHILDPFSSFEWSTLPDAPSKLIDAQPRPVYVSDPVKGGRLYLPTRSSGSKLCFCSITKNPCEWSGQKLPCEITCYALIEFRSKLVLVGGQVVGDNKYCSSTNQVWSLNAEKNEWDVLPPMKNKRYFPVVVTWKEYLAVIGGCSQETNFTEVEVFNSTCKSWIVVKALPQPFVYELASAVVCDEDVYVMDSVNPNYDRSIRPGYTISFQNLICGQSWKSVDSLSCRLFSVRLPPLSFNNEVIVVGMKPRYAAETKIYLYTRESDERFVDIQDVPNSDPQNSIVCTATLSSTEIVLVYVNGKVKKGSLKESGMCDIDSHYSMEALTKLELCHGIDLFSQLTPLKLMELKNKALFDLKMDQLKRDVPAVNVYLKSWLLDWETSCPPTWRNFLTVLLIVRLEKLAKDILKALFPVNTQSDLAIKGASCIAELAGIHCDLASLSVDKNVVKSCCKLAWNMKRELVMKDNLKAKIRELMAKRSREQMHIRTPVLKKPRLDINETSWRNAPQNTASSLDQPASTLTQQHSTDVVSEQIVSTLTRPSLARSGVKWPLIIAAFACVVFAVLAMMFQTSVVSDGGYTSMAPQQEEDIKSLETFPQMEQLNPLKRSGGKSPVTDKLGESNHELGTKLSKDDRGDTHAHTAPEDECMKSLENFPQMNEIPKMEQLYLLERSAGRNDVRIIERIGASNHELGTKLLEDDHGVKMQTIEDNARGKNEKINHEIFRRWLTESRSEVNWKVLLDTLIKVKFKQLACDIVDALNDRESKMTL